MASEQKLEGVMRLLAELKPHGDNYRQHPARQLEVLRTSLRTHGQQKPIVITPENTILAGHGIVEAARLEGWTEIVCHVYDGPNPEAFLVMDNRSASLAEDDEGALAALLERLQGQGDSHLAMSGYGGDELSHLLAKLRRGKGGRKLSDEQEPEAPTAPRVERGQIWRLGGSRLMCGDCTSPADVERVMGELHSPLLFTSPPYGSGSQKSQRVYGSKGDELGEEELARFLSVWAPYASLLAVNLGIAKKDHAVIPYWDVYLAAAAAAGLKLLSWNVWDRLHARTAAQAKSMFPIEHEWVFVFGHERVELNLTVPNKGAGTLSEPAIRQYGGEVTFYEAIEIRPFRPIGTVTRLPSYGGRPTGHPAMFPMELPLEYIMAATQPGQLVLDPFIGSGSTLLAAHESGRTAVGMDIEPRFCDITLSRWEALSGEEAILQR